MALTDTNLQHSAVTDEQLIPQIRSGNDEAFDLLVARYTPLLQRLSSHYGVASAVERDDLAQEGLLGLLAAVNTYRVDGTASFATYARTCMRNRMITVIRRVQDDRLVQCIDEEPAVPEEDPAALMVRREEVTAMRSQLRSVLSDTEYQVFMRYLSTYSYEEIASALSMDRKAVDNALQRARRKLAATPYLFRR